VCLYFFNVYFVNLAVVNNKKKAVHLYLNPLARRLNALSVLENKAFNTIYTEEPV